jgi:transposase
MGGVAIRADASASALRERACMEKNTRVARRGLAIAMVLEGYSRTVAARAMGMDRQALRDAIHRFNAEDWDGLYDRPRSGRPRKLTQEQQAKLKANILEGPPQESEQSEYRIRHLIDMAQREFEVSYSPSGLRAVLKRLDLSWMTCRPRHPKTDLDAQEAFKADFSEIARKIAEAHPNATALEIWFEDEARAGQKGSLTHRWAETGTRPRAVRDRRFKSAWIFGAVCPARDLGVGLVFPKANTAAMAALLQEMSLHVAPGAHALLIIDQAGWHMAKDLTVPPNITLVPLPPYSPELNPTENIWEFIRANYLSHKVYKTAGDVIDACCRAWNTLVNEVGRIRSIGTRKWATV